VIGEVAEQQGVCVGGGCDLGQQILDLVRSDRLVKLDDQPGDGSELCAPVGGEFLGRATFLVTSAEQYPRRSATACPAAVGARLRFRAWHRPTAQSLSVGVMVARRGLVLLVVSRVVGCAAVAVFRPRLDVATT